MSAPYLLFNLLLWSLFTQMASSATATNSSMTTNLPLSCPIGYYQKGGDGADKAGCGLELCGSRYGRSSESCEACATHCDTYGEGCLSFTFAPDEAADDGQPHKVCTIYDDDAPDQLWPNYQGAYNQIFCHKGSCDNCMWRQTGSCAADGSNREPGGDKSCSASFATGRSGYCDCNGNNVMDADDLGYNCSSTPNCNDACGCNLVLLQGMPSWLFAVCAIGFVCLCGLYAWCVCCCCFSTHDSAEPEGHTQMLELEPLVVSPALANSTFCPECNPDGFPVAGFSVGVQICPDCGSPTKSRFPATSSVGPPVGGWQPPQYDPVPTKVQEVELQLPTLSPPITEAALLPLTVEGRPKKSLPPHILSTPSTPDTSAFPTPASTARGDTT